MSGSGHRSERSHRGQRQTHDLPVVRSWGGPQGGEFYAATFPDSHVGAPMYAPSDFPGGREGVELTVAFTGSAVRSSA